MQVLMREGSVSKDPVALIPPLDPRTSPFLAFCTDDRNPLDIAEEGYIDHPVRKSLRLGAPLTETYRPRRGPLRRRSAGETVD
jgi:adenine deaminase